MRFWIGLRVLALTFVVILLILVGSRMIEITAVVEADKDFFSRNIGGELMATVIAPITFIVGLAALPFEIFILRRSRALYFWSSLVIVGLNAIFGLVNYLQKDGYRAFAVLKSMNSGEWLSYSVVRAAYFYYFMWLPIVFFVGIVAIFLRKSKRTYLVNLDAKAKVAFDSGPTLGYLGLLLAGTSVAQAFQGNWIALAWQLGIGVILVVLVITTLSLYKRSIE
ncbi:hypothetical protein [Amycolatopsis sp. Hca4]|uniref:hypothetical protein n=1 Tax=Amycolatopsis sp. Hca4 TaxID=2742131 RepID=UPI001591C33B|nr:hypothetical protein [Amycolatopsis sp. Hca4]QKV80053.1 hypothetical protein HUT10_44335 [Amycolatopsis sp. Hca4]